MDNLMIQLVIRIRVKSLPCCLFAALLQIYMMPVCVSPHSKIPKVSILIVTLITWKILRIMNEIRYMAVISYSRMFVFAWRYNGDILYSFLHFLFITNEKLSDIYLRDINFPIKYQIHYQNKESWQFPFNLLYGYNTAVLSGTLFKCTLFQLYSNFLELQTEQNKGFLSQPIDNTQKSGGYNNNTTQPYLWAYNANSWITAMIWEAWLKIIDDMLRSNMRKIALIVDNCAAHMVSDRLTNIELAFIPPNLTSILQPWSQGIIHTVKAHYRSKLVRMHFDAIEQGREIKPQKITYVLMIVSSFYEISDSTIIHCFRHAGWRLMPSTEKAESVIQSAGLSEQENLQSHYNFYPPSERGTITQELASKLNALSKEYTACHALQYMTSSVFPQQFFSSEIIIDKKVIVI